jgi:hypothetical protein
VEDPANEAKNSLTAPATTEIVVTPLTVALRALVRTTVAVTVAEQLMAAADGRTRLTDAVTVETPLTVADRL